LRGRADIEAFSDDSVADPRLRAFGGKLRFRDDPAFDLESARVRLRLRDGREISRFVKSARGGLQHPMSDEELEQKFAALLDWRGLNLSAGALVSAVSSIEEADDGAAFLRLTRAERQSGRNI